MKVTEASVRILTGALLVWIWTIPCSAQSNHELTQLEQRLFGKAYGSENAETRLSRMEIHLFGSKALGSSRIRMSRIQKFILKARPFQPASSAANQPLLGGRTILGGWKLTFEPPLMVYYQADRGRPRESAATISIERTFNNTFSGSASWSLGSGPRDIGSGDQASVEGEIKGNGIVINLLSRYDQRQGKGGLYRVLAGSFQSANKITGRVSKGESESSLQKREGLKLPDSGWFTLERPNVQ